MDESKTNIANDNLVELSSYRARLARGRRTRRVDDIFASSDPPAAIRALPPDEFFYVVHELGFPEGIEVLVHGTAEQVQVALDFALWDRDTLSIEQTSTWLGALVEAPPAVLGKWAQGIDIELLALLVRLRARIYDLSLDEEPDEPEGVFWNSPDRLFVLDILGEPDQARVTQHLVDSLYRYSPDYMRRVLVGMRAEFNAELEETAYRWRAGRMADLGFADYYEALEVYRELDPATVHLGGEPNPSVRPKGGTEATDSHLRLPMIMAERLSGRTPFARAVAGLASKSDIEEVHFALVALCNRALSADRVAPTDEERIAATLERVSATLDLAIEFLAHGEASQESAALRSVALVRLHRLGTSLVSKVGRLAQALVRGNPFAGLRPALDIFEREDSERLASLLYRHPRFSRLLDTPPTAGERPFATLADIALAASAVERAAAAIKLLTGLGIRPQHVSPEALVGLRGEVGGHGRNIAVDPATIDAGVLARTLLVGRMLGASSPGLSVLSPASIEKFKQTFNKANQADETAVLSALEILASASPEGRLDGPVAQVARRWVASLFPLGPVLGSERI